MNVHGSPFSPGTTRIASTVPRRTKGATPYRRTKSSQKSLNNEVLGSEGNEAQYKIPTEKQKGESTRRIGTIKMENYRMRKIINKLDKTIEMSVANNDSDGDATSSRKQNGKNACITTDK